MVRCDYSFLNNTSAAVCTGFVLCKAEGSTKSESLIFVLSGEMHKLLAKACLDVFKSWTSFGVGGSCPGL